MTVVHAFEDQLSVNGLSALMRSTWTWDDRALRRDLAALLVDLDAARSAALADYSTGYAEALRARALASGAQFVIKVLGPRYLVSDEIDAASFGRAASSSFVYVGERAAQYSAQRADIDYPPESSWLTLVSTQRLHGVASSMRGYGFGLSASNFFGNVGLAWQALCAVDRERDTAVKYAKAIESGSISSTLAAAEKSGSWDPALVRTKAVHGPDGWQLSGTKLFVPAADGADVYFVVARSIAGPSLFAVERSAPGLRLTAHDVVDATRPLHRVELADTPATLIGAEGGGGRLMLAAVDLATTALAGEQVGLIEKSMSLLAAANPPRESLADVTLQHVAAVSLWQHAVNEAAVGSAEFPAAAAAAHIGCSSAAVQAATVAAELLGPSSETDALLRRAVSASLLLGGPAVSHERLLERLGV